MGANVGKRVKLLWSTIVHTPDVLFEVRQLFLGLVIVVVVCYGMHALLIQPKQTNLQKKIARQKEFVAILAKGEIEAMVEKQFQDLTAEKMKLTEQLTQLRFQRQLYQEQFQGENAKEQFSNAIFTLLPDSPVDIERQFLQMNVMDARSFDGFDVYPVNLQGDAAYSEFIAYLRYLENRPEVGTISDLVLEQLVAEDEQPGASPESVKTVDAFSRPVRVHFSVVLGRVQLR